MSDGAERREARRFTMSLPLCVTACNTQHQELKTQTRDVSYRGLYFMMAEAPFQKGNEIDFVITLPQHSVSSGDVNIRCRGQVVRVDPAENGYMGIAAKIGQYEFIPASMTAA